MRRNTENPLIWQPQIAWKVADKFSQIYSYWFIQLYRVEGVRTHSTKTGLKFSGDREALVASHPGVTCKAEQYYFYCEKKRSPPPDDLGILTDACLRYGLLIHVILEG